MFNWIRFFRGDTQEEKWQKLENHLKEVMFGQHIAVGEVFSCLHGHFFNPNPTKALVIICNGSLGTGKTYFSDAIVNGLYTKSEQRTNFVRFVGPRDFPDSNKTKLYQAKLKTQIEGAVKRNPRMFFVFDEVDKMPLGLLDMLTPYVDRFESIDRVDYRKCIFMFLSNTGGSRIDDIVLKQATQKKKREHLLLFDFRKTLQEIVYNEEGGLKGSAIISKKLIDHFVPFLPLEKCHIIDCLEVEYIKIHDTFPRRPNLQEIAELFDYYPEDNPIFSEEGAKNVSVKILMAREFIRKNLPFPTKLKAETSEADFVENGIAVLQLDDSDDEDD